MYVRRGSAFRRGRGFGDVCPVFSAWNPLCWPTLLFDNPLPVSPAAQATLGPLGLVPPPQVLITDRWGNPLPPSPVPPLAPQTVEQMTVGGAFTPADSSSIAATQAQNQAFFSDLATKQCSSWYSSFDPACGGFGGSTLLAVGAVVFLGVLAFAGGGGRH